MKCTVYLALLVLAGNLGAEAKEIDLRNQTDADKVYNIAFCARASPGTTGLPGHMFVAFSSLASDGQRSFVALGHTVGADVSPAAATWSYFGAPVSGSLKEEIYTSISQQCLDVRVNKADYDRAFALTVDPLAGLGITTNSGVVLQEYRLGAEDCMTFASGVAAVLKSRGLAVPDREAAELPLDYMQRMIEQN